MSVQDHSGHQVREGMPLKSRVGVSVERQRPADPRPRNEHRQGVPRLQEAHYPPLLASEKTFR